MQLLSYTLCHLLSFVVLRLLHFLPFVWVVKKDFLKEGTSKNALVMGTEVGDSGASYSSSLWRFLTVGLCII